MAAMYADYRLRLRLSSALGTKMRSDTLFGHLCWQVRHRNGDSGVSDFLRPYIDNDPTFILSDAFPADLLPMPVFPPEKHRGAKTAQQYASDKMKRKAHYLKKDAFITAMRSGVLSGGWVADPWRKSETPHASLDRLVNSTGTEAGKFFFTEAITPIGEPLLDIYIRTKPDAVETIKQLFDDLAKTGFGKDKSTGLGAFSVASFDPFDGFKSFDGATGIVSLGTLTPAANDPTDGSWRLKIKRGFLGETIANETAGKDKNPNPYKRPLAQFEPGAIFRINQSPPPFIGRIVKQIAPGFPEAVQCGLVMTAPCVYPSAV